MYCILHLVNLLLLYLGSEKKSNVDKLNQYSRKTLVTQLKMATGSQDVSIHWFRLDSLRLHDNPALYESLTAHSVKFVFILDPRNNRQGPSATVWRFLLESLKDLDNQLQKNPYNSRLLVFRGEPTVILPKLIKHWKATKLTFQASQSSYETLKYDKIIANIAQANGASVVSPYSHTLFTPEALKSIFGDKPAPSFKEFVKNVALLSPSSPVSQPSLCHTPQMETARVQLESVEPEVLGEPEVPGELEVPGEPEVLGEIPIPSLEDLGLTVEHTSSWIGGETQALSRLSDYLNEDHEDKNMLNWLLAKNSLSPYFRFGCLSVRHFFEQLQLCCSCNRNDRSSFLTRIKKNLLLKEYSYHLAMVTPNFDQQLDNPHCLPIPWENDDKSVRAVVNCQTGIPWIDAIMVQITKEGWAHYLARKSVAYFLTRGCLWQSWEIGKAIFSKYLLDYEDPICVTCWVEDSCCGFISGQVNSFSPCQFGHLMDPEGIYIRANLPALQNFPPEYIHAPWTAPRSVQEKAGYIIGEDYPEPIVDVEASEKICQEKLKLTIMNFVTSINSSMQKL